MRACMIADFMPVARKNLPVRQALIDIFYRQEEGCLETEMIKQGRCIFELAVIAIVIGEADGAFCALGPEAAQGRPTKQAAQHRSSTQHRGPSRESAEYLG